MKGFKGGMFELSELNPSCCLYLGISPSFSALSSSTDEQCLFQELLQQTLKTTAFCHSFAFGISWDF